MARKDVDLVIRARDEAAKVVDTITASLNAFTEAQLGLDSRSEKTESSLSNLGAAIKQLDANLKGLDVGAKLTRELDTAAAALARMETRFETTAVEATNLERQLRNTEAQTARYAAKLAGAAAAQERQSAAIKKAKADQSSLTAALNTAAAAQAKLETRQAKLPGLIDRQSDAAAKAAQRYNELSAQIAGTVKPTQTLQSQFDASARNAAKTSARLAELRAEYSQIGGRINAAGSAFSIFSQQSERAAASVARQQAALAKITKNLATLRVQAAATATQQSKLASSSARLAASLAQQQAAIQKAEQEYIELATAAGKADAALAKLGKQGSKAILKTFGEQRTAAIAAKKEYLELAAASTRLGAQLARTTAPSAALTADFERSVVAAKQAKTAYLEQQRALQAIRTAYKSLNGDLSNLAAVQQRVASIQQQLAAALRASGSAAAQQNAAINATAAASRRAEQEAARLAAASERNARAADRGAAATNRFAAAYRNFYGSSRQSLSLLQRIRGEILSLVAAYGGLYGAISVLRETVTATQQLEAAQSRLGVAFDGDAGRVSTELDFLRRTSDRLGISLGVLATEYSKFNIAAKNTSLEGEAARKIFVSVAEAARVNRSSTAEMAGVFTALTQIVSKGAVQMEELRQQLGDRLPGALKIMADGLGKSTAELIKMMEQGQVTEAALIPFANELDRRFGPGLAESLGSTSVALGRLGNAAFQALIKFGEAGFIESFADFANTLTAVLQSADFEAFASRASAALGGLVDLLGFAAENFQLVIAAVAGFVALKLSGFVVAAVSAMGLLTGSTVSTARGFRALSVALATGQVSMTRMGVAARGLTIALRGLLSSTGIGLAVTAIAVGLSLWAGHADDATESLNEHQKIVDRVRTAYEQAGGAVEAWRDSVEDLTVTQVRANLQALQKQLREVNRDFRDAIPRNIFGTVIDNGPIDGFFVKVDQLRQAFEGGAISATDLREGIDKLQEEYRDTVPIIDETARTFDAATAKVVSAAKAVEEAQLVLDAMTGTAEETADALNVLTGAAEDVEQAMDPERTAGYGAAMSALEKIIEDTNDDLQILQDRVKIEGAFEEAIANAQTLEEKINAAITRAEALDAVSQTFVDSNFGNFASGDDAAAAVIRQFEGFRETPYFDVNAFRVGYGSDTITLADGSIKKVVQGMRVSVADANRDLLRRIATEFRPTAERAAGAERFATFSPQQQAALISIAYNYGEIPDRIVEAVRTGTDEQIASAITSLSGDNGGVNAGRRRQEAALFRSSAGEGAQIAEQQRADEERARLAARQAEEQRKQQERVDEERARQAEERLEQQREFREGLQAEIADTEFQNSLAGEALIPREVAKALREAELAAQAAGVELTAQERDQIESVTRAKFAQRAADEAKEVQLEKAKKAEAEVNRLLTIRTALEEQLARAKDDENQGRVTELKEEMMGVNEQMLAAIENAKQMWAVIGGPDSEAAIAKLNSASDSAQRFGQEGVSSYFSWSRVEELFASGLVNAFDSFSRAVAEGQSAGEAARTAFLQFASDFLLQIAKMIIQQIILNALKAAFGGAGGGAGAGGGFLGSLFGLGHTGGYVGSQRVGSGNNSRRMDPSVFAGASRYHTGGIAGLRPGEVPIIAQQGEEILTKDDPRHMMNAGKGKAAASSGGSNTRIVNAFDGTSFLEEALKTREGEEVMLNYVSANRAAFRSAMGV